MVYISILRGINVSGQKLIKMDALKRSYESLGYQQVTSYVQSGNVIFDSAEAEQHVIAQKISVVIKRDFGFDVPVIVLSLSQLGQIIDQCPWQIVSGKDPAHFYITFLAAMVQQYDPAAITDKKQDGEEISFAERAVYLYCPNGYGNTKLHNSFLESKLKVGATTRNWKTSNALLRIAQELR
jgi:uncharacterized protein (DUF1697 family)